MSWRVAHSCSPRRLLILLLALIGCEAPQRAAPPSNPGELGGKVSAELRRQAALGGPVEALVVFREPSISSSPTASSRARISNRSMSWTGAQHARWLARRRTQLVTLKARALGELRRRRLGTVLRDYPSIAVVHLRLPHAGLKVLAQLEEVTALYHVEHLRPGLAESLPLIGAPGVHALGTDHQGAGTTVAVLDTGCDYTRAAFGSCSQPGGSCAVVVAADVGADDGELDDHGGLHGTNVSAIALGVAPEAKIAALDVFTEVPTPEGTQNVALSTVLVAALQWVVDNRATYNIASANLSLGGDTPVTSYCEDTPIAAGLRAVYAAGVIPSIAAGNDAFADAVDYPSCAPWGMAVGATYDGNNGSMVYGDCSDPSTGADQVTCFSNSQRLVDLVAPGARISAAGVTLLGTSMAAPHVAGAVAVIRGVPGGASLTNGEIWARLRLQGGIVADGKGLSGLGLPLPRLDLGDYFSSTLATDHLLQQDNRLGTTAPAVPDGAANGSSAPLSSSLQLVAGVGETIDKAYLDLDVGHPGIAQLEAALVAPDGTRVLLHARTAKGSPYNLKRLYGVPQGAAADLDRLRGKALAGTWTLELRDVAPGSTGKLWGWSLWLSRCDDPGGCATSCGDGSCDAGETESGCPSDCAPPPCGDGTCEGLETCVSCATDCGSCEHCGDGVCQAPFERCDGCAADCACGVGETCGGDGTCQALADASVDTSPADAGPDAGPDATPADATADAAPADAGADSTMDAPAPDVAPPPDTTADVSPVSDTTVDTGISPDTTVDAGISPDTTVDAGISPDTTVDAGISPDTTVDAGISPDTTVDAGISPDTTVVVDTGVTPDTTLDGPLPDTTVDGGTSPDSTVDVGTSPDTTVDGGTSPDSTVDVGTSPDTTVDAGTSPDTTVDVGVSPDTTVVVDAGVAPDTTLDAGPLPDLTVDLFAAIDTVAPDATVDAGVAPDTTVDLGLPPDAAADLGSPPDVTVDFVVVDAAQADVMLDLLAVDTGAADSAARPDSVDSSAGVADGVAFTDSATSVDGDVLSFDGFSSGGEDGGLLTEPAPANDVGIALKRGCVCALDQDAAPPPLPLLLVVLLLARRRRPRGTARGEMTRPVAGKDSVERGSGEGAQANEEPETDQPEQTGGETSGAQKLDDGGEDQAAAHWLAVCEEVEPVVFVRPGDDPR